MMSAEDEKIEDLIDTYENEAAAGEPIDLDDLCRDAPELKEKVRQRIEKLFMMDQFLGGGTSESDASDLATVDWTIDEDEPLPAGRYRPEGFHAKGALGEVFLAKDEELDRQVVLKRINARQAQFEENCLRFETEARITGRLEHPGVVPVYGLGRDGDGKPVYAMRFIDGQTLASAIDDFHHHSDQQIRRTNVVFLQLMQRFVTLCQTVAYAHNRGIIHRDIKPANVMLGKYGETLLVDWGLAKSISNNDNSAPSERDSVPAPGWERGETEMGVVKGSPAYMSPEQADGRWDLVGPPSDIYNLGASLFHLITGRRPFSGETKDVIQRVIRGERKAPREINLQIPPAVEAICLKAMAQNIEDRYADARELASDIERWIADEAVTAFRDPWHYRKLRWLRRHRTIVAAMAVGLLVLVASLTVANWMLSEKNQLLSAANQETDAALQQTQKERGKAETSLKQALGAVHSMLLRIGRNEVTQIPEMQNVRREMLEDAVEFLQGFVGFEGRSDLAREQALALQYLGKVQALLGNRAEAAAGFRRAINLQQQIVDADPQNTAAKQDLGLSLHELGRLLLFSDPQAAEDALRQSVELIESLEGRLVGFDLPLAEALNQLGTLYSNTNRPESATKAFQRSIALRERFLADADEADKDSFRGPLAHSLHNLGTFHLTRGDVDAAEQSVREADRLLQHEPSDAILRRSFRNSRFEVCNSLATIAYSKGQLESAIAEHERALEVATERANLYPNVSSYEDSIAQTHHNLANVYMAMQRKTDSLQAFQAAVKIRRPLAKAAPDDAYQQAVFGESCAGLAHVLGWCDELPQSEIAFREALSVLEPLAESHSEVARFSASLCSCQINYGNMLGKMGKIDESLTIHQQVIDRAKEALEKDSGNEAYQLTLLNAHGARANTLIIARQFAKAVIDCDGVVAAAKPDEREFWMAWRLPTLARVDYQRAYEDIFRLSDSRERKPEEYYNLACSCAIAMRTILESSLTESEKQRLRQTLRDKAFELVDATISHGFFTSPETQEFLDRDTDFDELRSDPRWHKIEQRIAEAVSANQQT